jgi:hypothetical protein
MNNFRDKLSKVKNENDKRIREKAAKIWSKGKSEKPKETPSEPKPMMFERISIPKANILQLVESHSNRGK